MVGSELVGKTKRGKGTKVPGPRDVNGLPIAIDIESANVAEVNLIEALVDSAITSHVPGTSA